LHTRSWEGQDGQSHTKMEVIANQVVFLDRKGAGAPGDDKVEEGKVSGDMEPEDLPF
jgi:single-strand DNA-binding protein